MIFIVIVTIFLVIYQDIYFYKFILIYINIIKNKLL